MPNPGTVAEIGPGAIDVNSTIHRKPSAGDRSLDKVKRAAGRPELHQTQTVPSEYCRAGSSNR